MHKLKEMLMNEIYEYEEKAKRMSGGKISSQELEKIHKLTDTVKNIDKLEMYEEFGEDGESSYARGGGRGIGRKARRDSMGRYIREGGYSEEDGSYRRGSSYEGGGTGGQMGGNMGGGSSYARGNQGGGRGGRGGSSYAGGSSYGSPKEHMIMKMEEMLEMTESPKERRAIEKCLDEIED